MSSPRALVPVERTAVRLGDVARPARGRRPVARFAFAVCYADQLDAVEPHVAGRLAEWTGPTRTGTVAVESHSGAGIDTALDVLGELGQGPDVLLRLADAVVTMRAAHPAREVLLVVARADVLWAQAWHAVGQS